MSAASAVSNISPSPSRSPLAEKAGLKLHRTASQIKGGGLFRSSASTTSDSNIRLLALRLV